MDDSLISVVIPAFNASRYIEQTIGSVINQTYRNWELLIIDDGSTDNQNAILSRLASEDSRIFLYSTTNQGVAAARNYGYQKAKGDYIAFLDADDVWLADNLKLKVEKLKDGRFQFVHSDAELIDEQGELLDKEIRGKEGNLLNDLLSWNGPHIPGPSSLLVSRQVIDTVGLFDIRLSTSADFDFFTRVAARFEIGRVPQVTWQYRLHQGNMHKNVLAMEKDLLLIYEKADLLLLFKSPAFRRKCRAKMFLVLGMSWLGIGRKYGRALKFLWKSTVIDFSVVSNYLLSKVF